MGLVSLRKMLVSHPWLWMCCSAVMPAAVVPFHIFILWYFWNTYSRTVDKRFCSCSCWDTVFKGTYESGIASYKHVYFNATRNSFKIWILIVGGIILLYECNKYLLKLVVQRRIRWDMVLLFLSSIFSHYYSWWSYLNYYNDDYYTQFNHQMFFTVTEFISTIIVLSLANSENALSSRKVLSIVGIANLHILAGGIDQFISNVLQGEGYAHQVVRDLGFIIPDILHILLPTLALIRTRLDTYTTRSFIRDRRLQKELAAMIFGVVFLFTVFSFL